MDSPTVTDETATGTAAPENELEGAATTDEAVTTDTPEGAEAGKQDTPTEPEKSAWEKKLDSLLEEPKKESANPEKSEPEDEPARDDAPKSEPKDEPAKEEEEVEPLVARLPGRSKEEPDFEVTIDAETQAFLEKKGINARQLVERASQATKGYARRQEIEAERAEVESSRAELEFIEKELTERPIEFMVDKIDAKQYTAIAEALLTRMGDAEFNAVLEKVAAWEGDPAERKVAAANAREEAAIRKNTEREESDRAKARAEYTNAVATQITSLVPDDMSDEDAQEFYDFAAHKLQQWARKQPKGAHLDPEQVPEILHEVGALEPYGLSLPEKKPGASRTQGKPAPKSPDKGDVAARAKARGQELKERRERRQNAATVPAGAGAEAANTRPPKGQTFDQRISWIEKFGIGK